MSVISVFFSICVIIARYGDALRKPLTIGVQKVIGFFNFFAIRYRILSFVFCPDLNYMFFNCLSNIPFEDTTSHLIL